MRLLGYFYFSLFDSHDFSALDPRNPDYMAVFDPIYSLCFVVALPVAELVVWTVDGQHCGLGTTVGSYLFLLGLACLGGPSGSIMHWK